MVVLSELLGIVRKNAFENEDGEVLVSKQVRAEITKFLRGVDITRFVLVASKDPNTVYADQALSAVIAQAIESVSGYDLLWVACSSEDILNMALLLCRLSTVSAVLILETCDRLRQAAIGCTEVCFLEIISRAEPFEEFLSAHLVPYLAEWLGIGGEQTTKRLLSLMTFYSSSIGVVMPPAVDAAVQQTCARLYPSQLSFEAVELRARTEQAIGFGRRAGWLDAKMQRLFLVAAVEVQSSLVLFIAPLSSNLLFGPRVAPEFEMELRRASVGTSFETGDTKNKSWKINKKSIFKFESLDARSRHLAALLDSGSELTGFMQTRRGVGVVLARLSMYMHR